MTETQGNVISLTERIARMKEEVAEAKAAREAKYGNPNPAGFDYSQDVPDFDDGPEESNALRQDQEEFNKYIREYNIVDLYNRWKPADRPHVTDKGKQNHKVRCPNPLHTDKAPSFGMHSGKNQWNCGTCGGGDNIALYAITHGFDQYSLKGNAENFRRVVVAMAYELGVQRHESVKGTYYLVPNSGFAVPEDEPEASSPTEEKDEVEDNVTVLPTRNDPEEEDQDADGAPGPEIDWRSFVPEGTFLWEWLVSATQDTCPEEYHVWTGLMAIGFALGKDVSLIDEKMVYGNLAVCLVGDTGKGKSRAIDHLKALTLKMMPDEFGVKQSVRQIGSVSSGEMLIRKFDNKSIDPLDPKNIQKVKVRGLADYDEFSHFVSNASRKNSTLRQQFMELMSAPSLVTGGSLGSGVIRVEDPYCSFITGTQDNALSGLISNNDDVSGFLNRWLFVGGRGKERKIWGGRPASFAVPYARFGKLLKWAESNHELHMEGTPALDVYAEKLWPLILKGEKALEAQGTSIGNRLEITAKKLVLLLSANMEPEMDEVQVEAVEQAVKLFEYLIPSYKRTDKKISQTDDSVAVDRVLHTIQLFADKKRKPPTAAEIRRNNMRYFKTVKDLAELLKNLEKLGMIQIIPATLSAKGGRVNDRYKLA